MKKLFVIMVMCITSICVSAQTIVHTVQRGETIESVAKKYGISVEELKQTNSEANDYFFVGMKLTIPVKKTISVQSTTNAQTSIQTNSGKTEKKRRKEKSGKVEKSSRFFDRNLEASDFSSIGITIGSDFSDLIGITYGIQGQYFLNNYLGATLSFGLNYGLVDDPDMVFKIGPSYVYPINNWLYVMGTACYTLSIAEYNDRSGTISGANIIPTIGFAIKRFRVGVNGEISWRNGGKVRPGTFLNISYAF